MAKVDDAAGAMATGMPVAQGEPGATVVVAPREMEMQREPELADEEATFEADPSLPAVQEPESAEPSAPGAGAPPVEDVTT